MKTKIVLYALTTLCFSLLFYFQEPGLNYLIFGIILIANSVVLDSKNLNSLQWKIVSVGIITSAFFTMYYGNTMALTMTIISFLILITVKSWKKSSLLVALIMGYISVFATIGFIILGNADARKVRSRKDHLNKLRNNKWLPIAAVVVVTILFLSLYCTINPVFENFVSEILNSVSWGWFFFTIFGTLLLYTFYFSPRIFRKVMRFEERQESTIQPGEVLEENIFWGKVINYQSEKTAALLMFAVLNILLCLLICTDFNFLFIKSTLPYGLTNSEYVHNGVGAVITSILLAIMLILFYFRGSLNFDKQNKKIKFLTYIWIIQNIVLVVMTMFKNKLYIDAYALTYERIGVYFYLTFSIIGLLLTLYKLSAFKTTWFLFKSNAMAVYIVLILGTAINWNTLITNYNMKSHATPDYSYLSELGYENYPILWEKGLFVSNNSIEIELKLELKDQKFYLPEQIASFLKNYETDGIQSYCYAKRETYQYFVKLAREGKLLLSYQNYVIKSVTIQDEKK